jgi:3-hydroxybutyryl-CoA dehydrogenase
MTPLGRGHDAFHQQAVIPAVRDIFFFILPRPSAVAFIISTWKRRKSKKMEIKKLGIVGAGTMGNGIAQVAAQIGCDVVMRDIKDDFVERGLNNIDRFLSKSVEKGKLDEAEKGNIMGRIKGTTDMSDLKDVDFVVEAVIEDLDLKKSVYQELDELCRPEVILATNTSSMSITEIAAATKRADQICGMHFFNPVPLMKLVEVIRGYATSDETVAVTTDLAKKMGKVTVEVKKRFARVYCQPNHDPPYAGGHSNRGGRDCQH